MGGYAGCGSEGIGVLGEITRVPSVRGCFQGKLCGVIMSVVNIAGLLGGFEPDRKGTVDATDFPIL